MVNFNYKYKKNNIISDKNIIKNYKNNDNNQEKYYKKKLNNLHFNIKNKVNHYIKIQSKKQLYKIKYIKVKLGQNYKQNQMN